MLNNIKRRQKTHVRRSVDDHGVPAMLVVMAALIFSGCQGSISSDPPIHINPNMDFQERFEAQEANPFFADNRAMREPIPGTVARGFLKDDTAFHFGINSDGTPVLTMPVAVTASLVERGQERYEIFCAVCHGSAGDGNGIIMTGNYGFVPAPTFHTEAIRDMPDGHFFNAITEGIRTMPSYASQIPVADRWAIVAYIRALQRSQNASADDVPEAMR